MEQKTGNSPGSLDDYRWLVGAEGRAWLARLRAMEAESRDPLRLAARLRKELSAERARLVLEQSEWRRCAGGSFRERRRCFLRGRGWSRRAIFGWRGIRRSGLETTLLLRAVLQRRVL